MYALGMCDTHYRQIRYQRKFGGRPYEPLKHVLGTERIQRSIAAGLTAPFPDLPNTGVNELRRLLEAEYQKRHA